MCEVEDIAEGAGVIVVGGGGAIKWSSRGAHPCQHLVYFEDLPALCLPDALVWLEGYASDQCQVRGLVCEERPTMFPWVVTTGHE